MKSLQRGNNNNNNNTAKEDTATLVAAITRQWKQAKKEMHIMHLDIYTWIYGYQRPSRIQQPSKKGNYKAKGNKERSSGETTNT